MENASKALIMAGSVLIALMIIGALLLMFNNLSSYQKTETQGAREAQIVEFNKQYETYNRNDVRGNDLYSLLNKVIDYNRRKSTAGTGTSDEGQYLAYQPMTIKYEFGRNGEEKKLLYNEAYGNVIFTGEFVNFELNDKTSNKLKNQFDTKLKKTYSTDEGMMNLASGLSNLYGKTTDKDKLSAISLWNKNITVSAKQVTGNTSSEKIAQYNSKIENDEDVKKEIYAYYEYMQFKRAHFKCTHVDYDSKTGRITELDFVFTNKFN